MKNWIPQLLCVFGRGIEKVNGEWEPTDYVERLSEQNGHPGVRADGITPWDDDPRVVIAGGEVNAVAMAMWYQELTVAGFPPAVLTFAAGRPAYIADDPDSMLTEGRVMYRHFVNLVGEPTSGTEVVFQAGNKNTMDDLGKTLLLAKLRQLSRIGIISVGVHIPRCRKFLSIMEHVPPELFEGIEVGWYASEPIALRYFPKRYAYLWEAMISPAYRRTAEREERGIADLRVGKYNFGSQGYEFAPNKS